MPVELRKRKAPAAPAAPAPPAKKASRANAKTNVVKAAASKVKAAVTGKNTKKPAATAETKNATNGAPATETPKGSTDKVKVGDVIMLEGFGGEVETNDGEKTTLKALVEASKNGVVIFTYPKASTPGCKLIYLVLLPSRGLS
jgi:peroxiredoxin Q/BCP